MTNKMKPKFFTTVDKLRDWYLKNHMKKDEILIGFYKVNSGKKSILYQDAIDEALAFGWIDGIRKGIDEISYNTRFTPRRKNSIWSQINIKRIAHLKKSGRMHPAGLEVFNNRNPERTNLYSFEQKDLQLRTDYEQEFRANKKAWDFFQSKPPSYRKPSIHWVISAKQEETRLRRLRKLIHDSECETTLPHLTRKT
jgi:uncharacterized protein YdeI (YjbR/CyaY-like superfamily)